MKRAAEGLATAHRKSELAVREAQEYLYQATRSAFRPGMGAYMPDRFFWARSSEEEETPLAGDKDAPPGEARH